MRFLYHFICIGLIESPLGALSTKEIYSLGDFLFTNEIYELSICWAITILRIQFIGYNIF